MNNSANVRILPLTDVTPEVVEQLNGLMRQLTAAPPMLTKTHLEEILAADTRIFVAVVDGRIVGTASVLVMKQLRWVGGWKGWLEDVVVDEGSRGMGIARRLMEAGIEYGWEVGCSSLNLTSKFGREDAWKLYESVGFVRRDSLVFRLEKS